MSARAKYQNEQTIGQMAIVIAFPGFIIYLFLFLFFFNILATQYRHDLQVTLKLHKI